LRIIDITDGVSTHGNDISCARLSLSMLHKLKLLELNMLAERKEDYLLHVMEVNNTQIQNYLTVSC